jgi:hypothetical protein
MSVARSKLRLGVAVMEHGREGSGKRQGEVIEHYQTLRCTLFCLLQSIAIPLEGNAQAV